MVAKHHVAAHSPAPVSHAPNVPQSPLFGFVRALAAELSQGKVELPSVPEIVTRLQRAMADENVANAVIVKMISGEPALAARLMTMANSAALNTTGAKIVDLRTAVSRVGFNIVRSAGLSYAMAQIKMAKDFKGLEKPLDGLWRRSVVIASIAHVIAKRFTTLNAEAALLAGLLSCVGRVYILTRTSRHPELFADQLAYQALVREWHANVAKAILENWNLPEPIVLAVAEHEDPEREQRGAISLTDVLAVASLLANFNGDNDLAQCAAPLLKPMKRMQLELEQCTQVLSESASEVAALQATLGVT